MQKHEIYDLVIRVVTQEKPNDSTINDVCSVLTTAYSDRAISISGWIKSNVLYIGIYLNANADFNRDIDRGPHPKDPKAGKFREFWGNDKSKMMRFPDGSLLESVKWDSPEPLKEMTLYALQMHYSPNVSIDFAPRDMSPIFDLPNHSNIPSSPLDAYEELVTSLRSLKLTVGITSVSPFSPYLRNTSVFPYEPIRTGNVCLCPPTIKILAKLEASSAWPLQLNPLLQFKIAIYIEIAKLLNEKNITAKPHYEGVNVIFRGYAFDIMATHEDELRHFKKTPHGDKIEYTEQILLRHHSFISALGSRFNSFPEAVRIAIRWVRSKGISSRYLSQEAIELLVASIYTGERPPSYSLSGFLRFLDLFVSSAKFVFTVSDAIPNSETRGLPLVVVSTYCERSEFTKDTMNKVTLDFLRAAAKQSLEIALEGQFAPRIPHLKRIFAIPTSHWKIDFVVNGKMRPHNEFCLFAEKRKTGRFEIKTKTPPGIDDLFFDFDPVLCLVNEAIDKFGSLINLWFDELGGVAIGVSFSDALLSGKEMATENLKYAQKTDETKVATDIDSILQQIKILGGELIVSMNRR